MFIQKLKLQNYRCFSNNTFSFDKRFVLIEGANGSGKTTILEALHFGCFLKSFRTNNVKNLVSFDKKHIYLQVEFEEEEGDSNQVQVGISLEEGKPKKLVRFNKKLIKSYKDLISRYRIISLTEDDLQLIQGAPEIRRYFLNQLLVLFKPHFISTLKKYAQIKEHRNSTLANIAEHNLYKCHELKIWSQQLFDESRKLQKERITYLKQLETAINELFDAHFPNSRLQVNFTYHAKGNIIQQNFEAFWKIYREKGTIFDEWRFKRSLFGAHLDDFSVTFSEKGTHAKARYFASRGQQKLVLFLIKIALSKKLEDLKLRVTLLLDDFLTDFDQQRLENCLSLLSSLSCQVFITCPVKSFISGQYLKNPDLMQIISL